MLILTRLLTLLVPIISAIPFWFVFSSQTLMFIFQIISLVLILLTFVFINKINEKKEYRPLITAEIFVLSMYLLSLLMERRIFVAALSLLTLFIVWAWLEINFKKNFTDGALIEYVSYDTVTFLIYASSFTFIYGVREFIVTPVWILCIIVGLVFLLIFNNHLILPVDLLSRWKQLLVTLVIQIQLFLIFVALPLPYYGKGALLASAFYSISRLFELFKTQKNSFKNYFLEIAVFLLLLMLILLTTRW